MLIHKGTQTLETSRLTLRRVQRSDATSMFRNWASDPEVTKFLTWSPYPIDHYIVAGAISESGSIKGPWKHYDTPLFDRNGGHAMFFDDSEGKKKMCIHCPERPPFERALILDILRFYVSGQTPFCGKQTLEVMKIRGGLIDAKKQLGEWLDI